MQLGPRFLLLGNLVVGEMLLDKRFPLGDFFIAPVEAQVKGEAYWPTHVMASDRIMRQRVGVVAVVIVAVNILEQVSYIFTQGLIKHQRRLTLWKSHGFGLPDHISYPPVVDLVLKPRCSREKAGQVAFVGTVQNTAGNIRHTLVRQHYESCEIVLKVQELAAILKQIAKNLGVGSDKRCRCDNGKLQRNLTFACEIVPQVSPNGP